MATLRFSMMEFASKAIGIEAMGKVIGECLKYNPFAVTEKSGDVKLSNEVKRLQNESLHLNEWVINHLIPMAGSYQALLLDRDKQIYTLYSPEEVEVIMYQDNYQIEEICRYVGLIYEITAEMTRECKMANILTDNRSILWAYNTTIAPYMEKLSECSHALREIIGLGNN